MGRQPSDGRWKSFEALLDAMRADVDRMREEVLAMEAELEAARAAAGR